MTLCIAAVADSDKAIVHVSDTRVSLGYTSAEMLVKATLIHPRWILHFAGNDIGRVQPIVEAARAILWDRQPSSVDVASTLALTIQTDLTRKIEAAILSPYALTVSEFVKDGSRCFPPDVYTDLRRQIEATTLGCEFLVCGFNDRDKPSIFHVKERGAVDDQSRIGLWAIGIGDAAALQMLFYRGYDTALDADRAAYEVCAAKFFAEPAGLSRETIAAVLNVDGTLDFLDSKAIRRIWKSSGQPRTPRHLTQRMRPKKKQS